MRNPGRHGLEQPDDVVLGTSVADIGMAERSQMSLDGYIHEQGDLSCSPTPKHATEAVKLPAPG
jgi:hypothetical protein